MKIKKGFVMRSVGGENVGVPVGEMAKSFHGMIKLNETGGFLWRFFEKEHTEEQAVQALLNEYAVDEALAKRDVQAFVALMQEKGFME